MSVLAASALVAATLLGGAEAPSHEAATAGERCRPRVPEGARLPGWARSRRATVLVDSVLLGAAPSVRARRPCWRVSVRGRPALMVGLAERGLRAEGRRVAPLVVVGLGYNSLWQRGRRRHSVWASRFDREARGLLRTLRRLGARQIVWVTLREPKPRLVPPEAKDELGRYSWYFPYVNGRLRRLDRRRGDLVLANWKVAADRPGVTYDSIHTNSRGSALMARTIWRTVSREARRQGRRRPS